MKKKIIIQIYKFQKRKKHSTKIISDNISSERMILKYRPNIKEIIKSQKKMIMKKNIMICLFI